MMKIMTMMTNMAMETLAKQKEDSSQTARICHPYVTTL